MPLNIYIYEHTYTKIKTEGVFIMRSFIFHTRNKSFHDIVISLVLYRKALQHKLFYPLLPNQKWHLLTNNMTDRHIDEPPIMGVSAALYVADYY